MTYRKTFCSEFRVTPTCVWFTLCPDGLKAPAILFEVGLKDTLADDKPIQYVEYAFKFDGLAGDAILDVSETARFINATRRAVDIADILKSRLVSRTQNIISTPEKVEGLAN